MLGWHIRDEGSTKALNRSTEFSFVRYVTHLFMKHNIPLALLSDVRKLADGVNAEFSFMMIMQRTDIPVERQLFKIVGSLANRSG